MQQQTNGPDLTKPTPTATPPPQQVVMPRQQQQYQWMHQQQQPQWMAAMQYPATTMMMMHQQQQQQQQQHHQQQMMMYPIPHQPQPVPYMSYYPQQQQQQLQQLGYLKQQQGVVGSVNGGGGEEAKTVWVGDLLHWMDETYLHTCFSHTGQVCSVKVIRNKQTGQSEGYGFVEFYSHETAEKVLQSYNGSVMPNTDQPFRLNWASFAADRRSLEAGSDLSIFVGDLATDVTDAMLQETFASKYPSVKGAKVVFDANTGRSKGYGFVRFGDESERSRAMTEMNGVYCSSRPMRVGVATPKRSSGYQQQYSSQAMVLAGGHASNGAMTQGSQSDSESNNTTIFVGGIDSEVGEDDLRAPFSQFGDVVSVKIPVGKGCAFVQFANRENAEEALENLNGTMIGKQMVRLSWGRSPANKQWRGDRNNHWNGGYYGGQGYNGNGYTTKEPSMYVAAAASGAS